MCLCKSHKVLDRNRGNRLSMLGAVLRNDFNVALQKHAADQVWSSYNKILHRNFFKTVVCETTTGVTST